MGSLRPSWSHLGPKRTLKLPATGPVQAQGEGRGRGKSLPEVEEGNMEEETLSTTYAQRACGIYKERSLTMMAVGAAKARVGVGSERAKVNAIVPRNP